MELKYMGDTLLERVEKGDFIHTPKGVMLVAGADGDVVVLLGGFDVYDRKQFYDIVSWEKIKDICQPATAQEFINDTLRIFEHVQNEVSNKANNEIERSVLK